MIVLQQDDAPPVNKAKAHSLDPLEKHGGDAGKPPHSGKWNELQRQCFPE